MIELPAVGDSFAGKYTIRELLGRGGNAAVFRATDEGMSRDVAVKIALPSESGYPPTVVGRFMREGRILATLVDPHNITMYDFGETDDGLLYVVFEYVAGEELGKFLKRVGPLEPSVVAHIVDQLLQGLEEAHQAGILHRDVKPANIMVFEYAGDPYRVKLLDFGIARPAEPGEAAVTSDGMVVGTPRYMAPEQMLGGELSPSSDLFSLGLVAYEMLTGEPAFDGATPREIARQQFGAESLRLPDECGPPAFRRLIEKMVARELDQRPTSARAVRDEMLRMKKSLARWTGMEHAPTAPHGAVAEAEPAPPPPPLPRKGRGQRFVALALGAFVVGLVLAVLLLRVLDDEPQPIVRRQGSPNRALLPPAGPPDPAPRSVPPAADLGAEVPRSGCGVQTAVGNTYLSIDTATGERGWDVHVPATYDGETPIPVVMIFHRSLKSGAQMLQDTKIAKTADEHGFFVLAPTTETEVPWREKSREINFVHTMVAETAKNYCLDLQQIYAIGEGRGGNFVQDLECISPISAIAVTLAGHGRKESMCLSERRTPRIRIYGTLDNYVPVRGGRGCMLLGDQLLSADDVEALWKSHQGCTGKTEIWLDDDGGTCKTWSCETPFVHCATTGGHDWPSAPPDPFEFPGCEEVRPRQLPIDYAETIWRFFEAGGRRLDDNEVTRWSEGSL